MGGSCSPLEAHKDLLLALIAAEPDLTLQEIRSRLAARGIVVAASSVWRFCDRHDLTFEKPSGTVPACGRRNGCNLSSWWKGAADGFWWHATPEKNMVHGFLRT